MPSPPMLPICNRLQGPCSWHQRDQSTQEIAEVVGDDPEKQLHDPLLRGSALAVDLGTYSRGEKPPAFDGHTVHGQALSLGDLRGKVVILNFWATWCPPCGAEMALLEDLHRTFGPLRRGGRRDKRTRTITGDSRIRRGTGAHFLR